MTRGRMGGRGLRLPTPAPAPPPNWNVRRAQRVLKDAQHQAAAGTSLSDRTLVRIASLYEPEAALTKDAFVTALEQAGWSKTRIGAAIARVESSPLTIAKNKWAALPFWARVAIILASFQIPYIGSVVLGTLIVLVVRELVRALTEDE